MRSPAAPASATVDPALADKFIQLGRYLHSREWMPAHTGNFSQRLGQGRFLLTADGANKGALSPRDLVIVDAHGRPLGTGSPRPSLEGPVHLALYHHYPKVNAVIHTHSVAATMLSKMVDESVELTDYELLKAIEGVDAADKKVTVPVFSNYKEYKQLANWFRRYVVRAPHYHGFLITGHGFYTWGSSLRTALRHAEAFEFMFDCELRMALAQLATEE